MRSSMSRLDYLCLASRNLWERYLELESVMHNRELVVKVTLFATIVSAAQCVPMRVMAASEVTSDSTETTQIVSTL